MVHSVVEVSLGQAGLVVGEMVLSVPYFSWLVSLGRGVTFSSQPSIIRMSLPIAC